ncbi:MAG: hypothetical protein Q7J73_00120 [Dehalococcoidales bacterium]|nr:hypothetical protein [Dehalococcoidales bacterium]
MKFGKRSLILISIFAFLVLVFTLNSIRDRRINERSTLDKQLTLTQSKISSVQLEPFSTRKTELEQQLSQTAAQLNVAEATLSQSINKTAIVAILLNTAKAHTLEITEMTLSGLTDASLEKVPASVVLLTVTLEGDMLNLVAFTTQLNSLFETGTIQAANITSSANITISTNGSGIKPQAVIKLAIYTVQGR